MFGTYLVGGSAAANNNQNYTGSDSNTSEEVDTSTKTANCKKF